MRLVAVVVRVNEWNDRHCPAAGGRERAAGASASDDRHASYGPEGVKARRGRY